MKIKGSDYASLIICLVFSVVGYFISFYPGFFIFGFGFIILSFSLFVKFKAVKNFNNHFHSVSVEGGRKFSQSLILFYFVTIGLIISGSGVLVTAGNNFVMLLCGVVILVFGLVMFFLKLFRFSGNNFIIFEESGLRVGRNRYTFLIQWDSITGVQLGEWNNVPYVFLQVFLEEGVERTIDSKNLERDKKKFRKSCEWNQDFFGSSFAFSTSQYGIDIALFYKAILQYWQQPIKRKELVPKKKIQ
ncbi:MAG: hypothetical protein KDK90_21385 [Leptospiraceae bacterium]|nr:hypothetical protein [Leptospiraceae bacterium]